MNKKQRPEIPGIVKKGMNEVEVFQNNTIRPIVKMQHDLFIFLFENYLHKRKINFLNFQITKKKDSINSIFSKDTSFNQLIIGSVLGHFSNTELQFYILHTNEIHKRIKKIVKKRIEDTFL